MPRLFSAYVIVDWSAASKPTTGADSVWIGVLKRDVRFRLAFESFNEATRTAAEARLNTILADLKKRSERALVGFDFPLGFPHGFAEALKLKGEPWRAAWDELGKRVVDKPTNVNNRFNVAAQLNRLLTDGPFPFWGAPPKDVQTWLSATKPVGDATPALRAAEALCGAKSVWQLAGAGAVGGQTLTGIPRVKALLDELGDKAQVWPFQTGWKALTEADVESLDVVFAEVYPALVDAAPEGKEILDRAQVRALCDHFAKLDEQNKLAPLFGPREGVDVDVVEREEGWILGV